MQELYAYIGIMMLVNVVSFLVCVYVAWRLFRAFLGMERGIWAIVSQLQIQNRHSQGSGHVEPLPIDPAATRRAHEVANSMFGR